MIMTDKRLDLYASVFNKFQEDTTIDSFGFWTSDKNGDIFCTNPSWKELFKITKYKTRHCFHMFIWKNKYRLCKLKQSLK